MRKLIHGIDLSAPGGVAALIEYHRSRHGGARMELDNGDPDPGDGDQSDKPDGQEDQPKPTPPATPDGGVAEGTLSESDQEKYGFPEGTKVKDMTPEQQAGYWRYHAQKWERTARNSTPSDYNDVKSKAQKWDEFEESKKTPAQKQIDEAREEGRKSALIESNRNAAEILMRAGLKARGKSEEDAADILSAVNLEAFTTEGGLDDDRIARYVNQIAGPVKGTDPFPPDMGAGKREQHRTKLTGAELYAQTHNKKTA